MTRFTAGVATGQTKRTVDRSPEQAATLSVAHALLVRGHITWNLRHTIDLPRLPPFVIGSTAGIPVGLAILEWGPAARPRTCVAALLILFALNRLAWQDAGYEAGGPRRGCVCRTPVLTAWRLYRTRRNSADHLVCLARVAARRASRGISTDRRNRINRNDYHCPYYDDTETNGGARA
jgi:hypothetical protein